MTSFIVSSFERRAEIADKLKSLRSNASQDGCTFCDIVQGRLPAYKIFEDDHSVAFLDILPIRRGHALLIPKHHCARLASSRTDLPEQFAARTASVLPRLCRAICAASGQPNFNIVNNNGYAQVVDHVHWHVVPAPQLNDVALPSSLATSQPALLLNELQRRHELDDDEAETLAQAIRKAFQNDTKASKL